MPGPTAPERAADIVGRARATRLAVLAVVWTTGLVTAFYGLLGAAARYGCSARDRGLARGGAGTFFGVLVILAVLAVVTLVTLLTHGRAPRRTLVVGTVGVVGIGLCYLGAHGLLQTA